jgi:hypothetical protein
MSRLALTELNLSYQNTRQASIHYSEARDGKDFQANDQTRESSTWLGPALVFTFRSMQ